MKLRLNGPEEYELLEGFTRGFEEKLKIFIKRMEPIFNKYSAKNKYTFNNENYRIYKDSFEIECEEILIHGKRRKDFYPFDSKYLFMKPYELKEELEELFKYTLQDNL